MARNRPLYYQLFYIVSISRSHAGLSLRGDIHRRSVTFYHATVLSVGGANDSNPSTDLDKHGTGGRGVVSRRNAFGGKLILRRNRLSSHDAAAVLHGLP